MDKTNKINEEKRSGILCPITSLPNNFGVGDFGPCAYQFIDELEKSKQSYWQVLPLGNTDDTGCPYATDSAFGVAEYYISLEFLARDFKCDSNLLSSTVFDFKKVNFKEVRIHKEKVLSSAFKNFIPDKKYENFLSEEKDWINDYCEFRTLSETRGPYWRDWGDKDLSNTEKERMNFFKFSQYVGFSQLANLKKYANEKKVKLVGDLPIFLSYNSMDVWKNPKQFLLNDKLDMEFSAGAAPDTFSKTGQAWGNPVYDWNFQKENQFDWWNKRLSFLKRYFDVVRIDHFRGFCATWIYKANEENALNGDWYNGPGIDLFLALKNRPEIIAEDLGHITPDVDKLREDCEFPGMRVFQFMLGGADNPHKLYNYTYNSIAYSGTHDCNTLVGWYKDLSEFEKKDLDQELKIENPTHWDMLEILMNSPAKISFIQIQDLLGLGEQGRFNYPGTVSDKNWTWRMDLAEYKSIDWQRLLELTKKTKRS